MVRARRIDAWDRCATQIAYLLNPHRDHDKRPQPFEPVEFMPPSLRPKLPKLKATIEDFREMFVPGYLESKVKAHG